MPSANSTQDREDSPNNPTIFAQDYTSFASPGDFIDQNLWPECLEIAGALVDHLNQATERIVRD